jgi:hypothetical protein
MMIQACADPPNAVSQAHGHLRRDAGAAIHQVVERHARHVQHFRAFGDSKA